MSYGDIIYNITDIKVSALASDNSYGTPVSLIEGQKLTWEFVMDEDSIKSYGLVTNSLSIATHAEGSLEQAALDFGAYAIMLGTSATTAGVSPNETATMDFEVGGAGLPYFGIMATYVAPSGANLIVGFPKCQLKAIPPFSAEQNQFRTGEVSIKMFAPSTTVRKLVRYIKNETAATLPTLSADWDTWFTDLF